MEEFSISVLIADRTYRLTIDRKEEEMVRRAAKLINGKIKEYALNYAHKDNQDLLAMLALQYSTASINYEQSLLTNNNELINKLKELDHTLSEHL
jgi:cell division protein ZapA